MSPQAQRIPPLVTMRVAVSQLETEISPLAEVRSIIMLMVLPVPQKRLPAG